MIGVFYRVTFDISCFYALSVYFLSYILGFKPNPLTFGCFLTAALVLAVSEKARRNSRTVAFASLAFPAVALVVETTDVGRILVFLPWIYLVILVLRGSYVAGYYQFMDHFKVFLRIWALPIVLLLLSLDRGVPALTAAIPYLLVFLSSGVMMLQALRYRSATESRKQFELFQIGQTILFFIASFTLTAAGILDKLFYGVIQPVWNMVSSLAVGVFRELMAVLNKTVPDINIDLSFDKEGYEEALNEAKEEAAEKFVEGVPFGGAAGQAKENVKEVDYTGLFVALVIIAGIIILAVLLSNRGIRARKASLAVESEELSEEDGGKEERPKKHSPNPVVVIRYYYCAFMKKAATRERELADSDTTKEIAGKYSQKLSAKPDKAEEITEIYRKARYSGEKMTQEEAAKMKKLVKEA